MVFDCTQLVWNVAHHNFLGYITVLETIWNSLEKTLGRFRLDYEYEIEYGYEFSILVFRFLIITT